MTANIPAVNSPANFAATFLTSGVSSFARNIADIAGDIIRPEQVNVDLLGLTDSGPKIIQILQEAVLRGKPARFDKGVYMVSTAVIFTLIGSLEIACHPDAVFVAAPSLNNKMFSFVQNDVNLNATVTWRGGQFDNSRLTNSPSGLAYDALTIGSATLDVLIERVRFSAIRSNGVGLGGNVTINGAGGSNYASTTTLYIPPPDNAWGVQAVAVPTIVGGVITGVAVTVNGYGYNAAPPMTAVDPTGAGSGATFVTVGVSDCRTAGGDSHIFTVGKRTTIRNCFFEGTQDAAIYASALGDGTLGEDLVIENCRFYKVRSCTPCKRGFKRIIWSMNTCLLSGAGFTTADADSNPTHAPGFTQVIVGNVFKMVTNLGSAIQARISDGSVVTANLVEDFGYDLDGNAKPNQTAIILQGTSGASFLGNTVRMKDWTTASTHYAFGLYSYTLNGTTYASTNNSFKCNTIDGVFNGFYENDNSQDANLYALNTYRGVTNQATLKGPTSTQLLQTTAGTTIAEGLTVAKVANAVSRLQVSGAVTGSGQGVVLNIVSTDANVNMTIGQKGTGSMFLGGTPGNEGLRLGPATANGNAIQINPAASGANPVITTRGSDTNIPLTLGSKGTAGVLSANPFQLPAYTFATLPSASTYIGCAVRVSDRNSRSATSDGTNWRYGDNSIAA